MRPRAAADRQPRLVRRRPGPDRETGLRRHRPSLRQGRDLGGHHQDQFARRVLLRQQQRLQNEVISRLEVTDFEYMLFGRAESIFHCLCG